MSRKPEHACGEAYYETLPKVFQLLSSVLTGNSRPSENDLKALKNIRGSVSENPYIFVKTGTVAASRLLSVKCSILSVKHFEQISRSTVGQ